MNRICKNKREFHDYEYVHEQNLTSQVLELTEMLVDHFNQDATETKWASHWNILTCLTLITSHAFVSRIVPILFIDPPLHETILPKYSFTSQTRQINNPMQDATRRNLKAPPSSRNCCKATYQSNCSSQLY